MHDYSGLFSILVNCGMADWSSQLKDELSDYFNNIKHGDYESWRQAIEQLPEIKTVHCDLDRAMVEIACPKECDDGQREVITQSLKSLMPWRKGPFNFFGVEVDAEWRSDRKWLRIEKNIKPLKNRMVLDIGCGNGYYLLRMLGQEARCVVGSDPTLRFLMQFEVVKHFCPDLSGYVLPLAVQDLPHKQLSFDTVFSMGVIYHRRNPIEHLKQLHQMLNDDGELVLEGLVITADDVQLYGDVLIPDGRYAKMNNVWSLPSVDKLMAWVEESGFSDVRLCDVSATTVEEQRVTEWMTFESLKDFLDPDDDCKTIEGYPAPKRAILTAIK